MFIVPVLVPVNQLPPSKVPVNVNDCHAFPLILTYPVLYTASSDTDSVNGFDMSVAVNVNDDVELNVGTGVLNTGEIGLVAYPAMSIGFVGSDGFCNSGLIPISVIANAPIRIIIHDLSLTCKLYT
jgi:hypothetical protein